MTVLVVGAGATGGYFGLRLAQAGRDVTFLVRPARAETLRQRGLRRVGLGEDEVITPNLVTAEDVASNYDIVLLAVKATALTQAIDDLAPAIGSRTVIVPFLNGIAHLDALHDRYGAAAVLGGAVRVATTLNEDGDVVQLAPLASLIIGAQDRSHSARLDEVAAELSGATFDLSISEDILAAMWGKWVFLASLGAFTCLMRGPVGEIVACPGGAELGSALLAETAAVSSAAGYAVPADDLAAVNELITAEGSSLASSMYRDVTDGAGTEVEHILGDLTARARTLDVPTPLLDLATLHLRVYQRHIGK